MKKLFQIALVALMVVFISANYAFAQDDTKEATKTEKAAKEESGDKVVACKPGCKKECCAKGKKGGAKSACKPGCKKSCCAKGGKSACKPGCTKTCCTKKEKDTKEKGESSTDKKKEVAIKEEGVKKEAPKNK